MTWDLIRREFLRFALHTVPVAALTGPLATLWPKNSQALEQKPVEVCEPVVLFMNDAGFVIDVPPGNGFFPFERTFPAGARITSSIR